MDKLQIRKILWLLVLLTVTLSVVVGSYVLADFFWPDSDKAAWTQAIGSVIGLCIAIFVPAWQHENAEELRRREAREADWKVLRLAWLLSSRATSTAESIGITRSKEGGTETPKVREHQAKNMAEIHKALESIPLIAIPALESLQYFMKVKSLVEEAVKEIHRSPFPEASVGCNELYGRPWIRLHNELKEATSLLHWHSKQYRSSDTKAPEPELLTF